MKKHKAVAPGKLGFAIITCSTSRFLRLDKGEPVDDPSGDLIESLLKNAGQEVTLRKLISDDEAMVQEEMRYALNRSDVDAVVFCGGTGISSSDITIETVSPFLEKTLPGFGEIFRRLSFDQIGSGAILSRAIAGVVKGKAIFCIPGSPDAVRLCVERLILGEASHIVKHARE
jgi:molybdenum cofactor biosynthesis protein B